MDVAFFDIDNTLLTRSPVTGGISRVRPRVAEAVRRLCERGDVALLCTGRAPMGVPDDLRALPFRGGVYFDGGLALLDGRPVYARPIDPGLVLQCAQEALSLGMGLLMSGLRGRALVGNPREFDWRAPTVRSVDELRAALPALDVYKMAFRSEDLPRYRSSRVLRTQLAYYQSATDYHELVALGVGKDVAARKVLSALREAGEGPGRVLAFGDSANDLPILRIADVAVAMGNATPAVKAQADYVTDDVDHDGVATALERLDLA